MRIALILVCSFFSYLSLQAQNQYANLVVDNDLFFVTDYYYSSGIFWQYGKQSEKIKEEHLRTYHQWELGQEMYTPSDRYSTDPQEYDYPYGGWSYVQYTRQADLAENKQFNIGLQLGVTGDWSLARWMQNEYHKNVLNLPENAWVDQVPEAVHGNVFASYFFQKKWGKYLKLMTEWTALAGTQRSHLGSRIGIAVGMSDAIGIGDNPLQNHSEGDGLYFGVRTDYVIHDYMVSGSLFNDDAPFTAEIVSYRRIIEGGIAVRTRGWRFLFMYQHRSRDNLLQPQKGHHVMTLSLSRFFG